MRTRAIIVANILVSALITTGCKQQTERQSPSGRCCPLWSNRQCRQRYRCGHCGTRFRTDLGFRVQATDRAPRQCRDRLCKGRPSPQSIPPRLNSRCGRPEPSFRRASSTCERRSYGGAATEIEYKRCHDEAEARRRSAGARRRRRVGRERTGKPDQAIEQLGYAQVKADFAVWSPPWARKWDKWSRLLSAW